MVNLNEYRCKVCGWLQQGKPWGDDGKTPTFEICNCCGVEFGYEDSTDIGIQTYREKWLYKGAKWFNPKCKPKDWDLKTQISLVT